MKITDGKCAGVVTGGKCAGRVTDGKCAGETEFMGIQTVIPEYETTLLPDADLSPNEWLANYAIAHYRHINKLLGDPQQDTELLTAVTNNITEHFSFSNVPADLVETSAVNVKVRIYDHSVNGANSYGFRIYLFKGTTLIDSIGHEIQNEPKPVVKQCNFSGLALDQTDSNNLRIKMVSEGNGWIFGAATVRVAVVNAIVTYTK